MALQLLCSPTNLGIAINPDHQLELNFTAAHFSALFCCLTSISSNFMLFEAPIEIKFLSLHLTSFGS